MVQVQVAKIVRQAIGGGLVVVMAACGDGAAGPVTELRIESVRPQPFAAGDMVEVRGAGVDRAELTLDGAPVIGAERMDGGLRFKAPDDLPRCRSSLPLMSLAAHAGGLADSTWVSTLGRPVDLGLAVGEHRVLEEVGYGCAVSFARPGTYGVALYRTATRAVDMGQRTSRVPVDVSMDGGAAMAGQASAPAAAVRPASVLGGAVAPDVVEAASAVAPSTAAAAAPCVKEPAVVGDHIRLTNPYLPDTVAYQVTSVSPHYQVLVEEDSLAVYDRRRRTFVDGFAPLLEERVQPFLDGIFEAWPDIDGDGRLDVIIGGESSASYSGAFGISVDGCPGDFVRLAHHYADRDPEAVSNGALATVVHEAMHWYDIGPDLSRQPAMEDWSIEAVASVAERWWRWERDGKSLDGNYGIACPAGATCSRIFLQEDRYGMPGLSRGGGYGHGMYLVWYLVLQAAGEAGALPALGHLRHRNPGPDVVAVTPIFSAAGGSGRGEVELEGEYLLSWYADDHVPGLAPGLRQESWDLTSSGSHYPLRAFMLSADHPQEEVRLARPDGIVFEVAAGAGSVLSVSAGDSARLPAGLAAAVVRAR